MLKVQEIRYMCYGKTYEKGRACFQSGRVNRFEVHPLSGSEGVVEVSGLVRGSGRGMYNVKVQISDTDEIDGYDCDCPASTSYWGMCKHCVAIALAFQQMQKQNSLAALPVTKGVRRDTAEPLSKLLYRYSVQNRMSRIGGIDGEVEIDLEFQPDRKGLLVEARIGTRRKYVVKNLVKLVHDVKAVRNVRYGAGLEFVHDLSAFTPEARNVIRLLDRAITTLYPETQGESWFDNTNNFRQIVLRGEMPGWFMEHFLGGELVLQGRSIPVLDRDPRPSFALHPVPGGAEIAADEAVFYRGEGCVFVHTEGAIYRCTPEFSEQVVPFWEAVRAGNGYSFYDRQPLFLSKEDYGSFAGSILKKLERYIDLDAGSIDFDEYAPMEPEFEVYLGMHAPDMAEASARVRYGEEVYDVLLSGAESAAAGGRRDLEKEAELRYLMETLFPRKERPEPGELKPKKRGRRKKRSLLWDEPVRDLGADLTEEPEQSAYERSSEEYPVRDLNADLMQAEVLAPMEDADAGEVIRPDEGIRRYAGGEEELFALAEGGIEKLRDMAEVYADESVRRLKVRPAVRTSIGVGLKSDLLELKVDADDLTSEEIAEILAGYRRKKKYFRLRNGEFLALGEDDSIKTLAEIAEGLSLKEKDLASGTVKIPLYRALYLDSVLKADRGSEILRSDAFRDLIRGIRDAREDERPVPAGLAAKLRRYQREGYAWLTMLCRYGLGGILADDMGLGKTIQVIAMLLDRKGEGTSLIVAPASLLYNWESEIHRFAPELSVQLIAGSAPEREEQIARASSFDVCVTSYDLLKRDVEHYEDTAFDCCVIDEAQYIKNAGTQAAASVKQIRASHRFALTGTPIENRLSDLWSIFDFLMPGYLYTYHHFREDFEAPIVRDEDEAAGLRLSRMTAPFLLRRRKEEVLKDLPDKLEESVYVAMTAEQKKIYTAAAAQLRQELAAKDAESAKRDRIEILAGLTRLRQICCSPELCYDNYTGGSGKVETALELLQSASDGGHRVLVFSQFTSMLELLRERWKQMGGESLYLSGKDSKRSRQQMVDAFQTGEIPVFFISLKAGGTGLNLTAADIVIHCDPWWNAAAQNQATDRAHRIGQTRAVSVMRLVARGSIEEKITELQERKKALADSVVEGEGVKDFTLDRDELLELFRE